MRFCSRLSPSTIVVLGIASSVIAGQEIWKITNLSLIIPGHTIKKYGVLQPDSDWESLEPKENRKLRKEICENVLKTPYFVKYNLRWIDAGLEEEREYVVTRYPSAGLSIFQKKGSWFSTKIHYSHDTSYRLLTTDMNCGREDQNSIHVFPCLVERNLFMMGEIIASQVEEYFISEPFLVSAPDFKVTDIAGRIVFTRRSDAETLRIEAFAADPGKWIQEMRVFRPDVENAYGLQNLAKLGNLS